MPQFLVVGAGAALGAAARYLLSAALGGGIQRLLAADGPCLAHVVIDPRDNVWPLVPPGKSNAEMMEGS